MRTDAACAPNTGRQKRIESDFVEMAAKDIPKASYQLEGINEILKHHEDHGHQ